MMSLCKVLRVSVEVGGVEYRISEEVAERDKGQDPSKNSLQGERVT